jgi:hypothetical protein
MSTTSLIDSTGSVRGFCRRATGLPVRSSDDLGAWSCGECSECRRVAAIPDHIEDWEGWAASWPPAYRPARPLPHNLAACPHLTPHLGDTI